MCILWLLWSYETSLLPRVYVPSAYDLSARIKGFRIIVIMKHILIPLKPSDFRMGGVILSSKGGCEFQDFNPEMGVSLVSAYCLYAQNVLLLKFKNGKEQNSSDCISRKMVCETAQNQVLEETWRIITKNLNFS